MSSKIKKVNEKYVSNHKSCFNSHFLLLKCKFKAKLFLLSLIKIEMKLIKFNF